MSAQKYKKYEKEKTTCVFIFETGLHLTVESAVQSRFVAEVSPFSAALQRIRTLTVISARYLSGAFATNNIRLAIIPFRIS
jgi:hypothetical protein